MRLALVLLMVPALVLAEPSDETRARGHFEVGVGLYRLGDYHGALKEFAAGYVLGKKPGFLLNIAQSYRQLGDLLKARETYQQFLVEAAADDGHRAQVKQSIAELSEEIRLHPPPPVKEEPLPVKVEQPASQGQVKVEPQEPLPTVKVVVERPKGRRSLRIAGFAVGAVGVVGLAGGLAAGLLANSAANDLNALDQMRGVYDPDRFAAYQTDRAAEYASLGIGAAALATGVILYVVGRR